MTYRLFIALFFAWCSVFGSYAQTDSTISRIKSIGIPLMESYTPLDYSSKSVVYGNQNFDMLMGDDGKLYSANIQGLLTFDGVNWTRLRLSNHANPYSLTKAQDGTIYVGGNNELGYLGNSTNGLLTYISLTELLREQTDKSFAVWNCVADDNNVFFISSENIFMFNTESKEFEIIPSPKALQYVQYIKGEVYHYMNDSLYQLVDDTWNSLRYSSFLTENGSEKLLTVDLNTDQSIVITNDGFFDFDSEQKIKIQEDVERFLRNSELKNVEFILDSYLSISTNQGVLITDLIGNPIQWLDKSKGLTDDLIYTTLIDDSGLLWLATNTGIDKVDISSPYSVFDERVGIQGNVSFVEIFEDDLYLATATGIYKHNWEALRNPLEKISFNKIDDKRGWMLLKSQDELFSLETDETRVLSGGSFLSIDGADSRYWTGVKYKNSDDLLVASSDGLMKHLSKSDGTWKVKKHLDPLFTSAMYVVEGEGQNIWVTGRNEVYKIVYDKEKAEILSEKKYGISEGLPFEHDNYVFRIQSKPLFTTYKGIHRYDPESDRFFQDEQFKSTVGDMPLLRMSEDAMGNVYCMSYGNLILKNKPDGFEMLKIDNEKVFDYNPFHVMGVDSANVLFPTFNAFTHLDPTIPMVKHPFKTALTSVESLTQKDTTYFGGFGQIPGELNLSHDNNALRFRFSAIYYQNTDWTEYKWRLLGSSDNWSNWSSETSKDFTNLTHGKYTLEVIAKNIHFKESTPAVFHFRILPPWYYTIWAYALYAILFMAFLWLLLKLNSRRLLEEKKKLESIVDERTSEIQEQKVELEQQHNQLVQMDDLKNRFFVNISHELRTPLTLIMGSLDRMMKADKKVPEEMQSKLSTSYRNSERLMKMVSNILDISKLEGGKMDLFASLVNPKKALVKVSDFFTSRFHDKGIQFELNGDVKSDVYLDIEKFETIFVNLLANAFKFTPNGGKISVELTETDNDISISVADNGLGIEEKDVPYVFDRFYQSTHIKSGEGMGVGLALTKELVDLHKGNINVKSELEKGTTFTVIFLKGSDHLTPNQIVETENKSVKDLSDKYPLHEDHEKSPSAAESQSANGNPHLLIVEDNREMSKFIVETLGDDYQISTVENGQQGLNFLKTTKPDLIITDYLMPVMDGYEMTTEIKKNPELEHLPIIFLTARAREQDKINVLNLGVNDYLFKPFNSEELHVRIKNLLQMKQQRIDYLEEQEMDPIEWSDFPSTLQQQIDAYIEEHIKEEINGEDLAEALAQSKRSVYRKVKANTGLSVMMYIREYRLRKARTMLENRTFQTVSEISYAVGFNYLSYFTRTYKERFGKQPSTYLE